MIEANEIFSDSDKRISLWCDSAPDTTDLAVLADGIIQNHIDKPQKKPYNDKCS